MISLIHKFFSSLLLLSAMTLNAHANTLTNYLKDAGELTAGIVDVAYPSVLLCILPPDPELDTGDIIGRVRPEAETGSYVCEYSHFMNDKVVGLHTTTNFKWLDMSYDQLSVWLTSFAHVEKNNQDHFFVIRHPAHKPDHQPAVCVQSSDKGLEFGYVSDYGVVKMCGTFVGAVYAPPATYEFMSSEGCKGETISPECHKCNGNGCGAFRCSAFTTWDECPKGTHQCGVESCVAGFCPFKPLCKKDE